jgi:thiamine biosynthesis lipoprotein
MPSPSPATEVRRARPLLGTLVEIRAAGPEAQAHAAINAAFAAVERVQLLMSFHDPASELSTLNREAAQRPVAVDAQTFEVLSAAVDLSHASDGAFDICVGAALRRWGYLPEGEGRAEPGASCRDLELLEGHRVRFHRPLCLDLGGIAKGYAVDRAVAILQDAGIERALVNAGGDLRAFGPAPWPVALRHPQSPAHSVHTVELRSEALATSANTFSRRSLGAHEVSPLLDPRNGCPWLGQASISVRAPHCLHADALTKVVLFAEPEVAGRLLQAHGAVAYLQQPLNKENVIPAKAGIQGLPRQGEIPGCRFSPA